MKGKTVVYELLKITNQKNDHCTNLYMTFWSDQRGIIYGVRTIRVYELIQDLPSRLRGWEYYAEQDKFDEFISPDEGLFERNMKITKH